MTAYFRAIPLILCLGLSGCVVGDGVAHVVKLVDRGTNGGSSSTPAPASPRAVASAPAAPQPEAPPAPMAAPRDDIKVEELAPPPFISR